MRPRAALGSLAFGLVLLLAWLPAVAQMPGRQPQVSPASFVSGDVVEAGSLFSGAHPMHVSLPLPLVRSGLLPSLDFAFGGNDPLSVVGDGWSFVLPRIIRDHKDGLDYGASRFMYFDGGAAYRLTALTAGRFTETVSNPSRRILFANQAFEVTSPSGIRYVFGNDDASRIHDPADTSHVYAWLLSSIADTNGNSVVFGWTMMWDTYVLDHIDYDVHAVHATAPIRVQFNYTQRPTPVPEIWSAGFVMHGGAQLASIDIKARTQPVTPPAWSLIRTYRFATNADASMPRLPRLTEIREIGADGGGRVLHAFTYSGGDAAFSESANRFEMKIPATLKTELLYSGEFTTRGVARLASADGGTLTEIGGTPRTLPAPAKGRLAMGALVASEMLCIVTDDGPQCVGGNGAFGPPPAIPWIKPKWPLEPNRTSFRIADVDGDGVLDYCAAGEDAYQCWVERNGAFTQFGSIPMTAADVAGRKGKTLRLVDIDGDRRADVCWVNGSDLQCFRTSATGIGTSSPFLPLSLPGLQALQDDVRLDFVTLQHDEYPDVCAVQSAELHCYAGNGRGFVAADTIPLPGRNWSDPATFASFMVVDVNGDGLSDVCLLSANRTDHFDCLLRAEGGFLAAIEGPRWPKWTLPGDATFGPREVDYPNRPSPSDPSYFRFIQYALSPRITDVNGDGREELCIRVNDEIVDCWSATGEPFRMTGWTNVTGLQTSFSYILTSQTDGNLQRLHDPLVSRIESRDALGNTRTESIWHSAGAFDDHTGQFRGFGRVTVRENEGTSEDVISQYSFHQALDDDPATLPLVGLLQSLTTNSGGYRAVTMTYQQQAVPGATGAIAVTVRDRTLAYCDGGDCLPPDLPPASRHFGDINPKPIISFPPWADPPHEWIDGGRYTRFHAMFHTPADKANTWSLQINNTTGTSSPSAPASEPPFPSGYCAYIDDSLLPGINNSLYSKCQGSWLRRLRTITHRSDQIDEFGNVTEESLLFSDPAASSGYTIKRRFVANQDRWIVDRPTWERVFVNGVGTPVAERLFAYDEFQYALDPTDCDDSSFANLTSRTVPSPFPLPVSLTAGNLTTKAELVSNGASGKVWRIDRQVIDRDGHVACHQRPTGNLVKFWTDPLDMRIVKAEYLPNLAEQFQYAGIAGPPMGGYGEVSARVDVNGDRSMTSFDEFGRIKQTVNASGGTTTLAYTEPTATSGPSVSMASSDGDDQLALIDGYGRITSEVLLGLDGKKRVRTTRFSPSGAPVQLSEWTPFGASPARWATAETDNAGRMVATKPLNARPATSCWLAGDRVAVEPGGRVVTMRFNAAGKLTELRRYLHTLTPADPGYAAQHAKLPPPKFKVDPFGPGDPVGVPTSPLLFTWWEVPCGENDLVELSSEQLYRFSYDPLGRLIGVIGPSGEEQTFSYTAHGRLAAIIDSEAGQRTFTYDATGLLASYTLENGNTINIKRDAIGRPLEMASNAHPGQARHLDYDAPCNHCKLRLTKTSFGDWSEEFTYNEAGLIASTHSIAGSIDKTVKRSYSPLGRLTRIDYPDGSVAQYRYRNGQLSSLLYNAETVWSADALDDQGRIMKVGRGPMGSITHAFHTGSGVTCADTRALPCSMHADLPSGTALAAISYTYDEAGNLATRTDAVNGGTTAYQHDPLRRITQSKRLNAVEAFTYNASDALTSSTTAGLRVFTDGHGAHSFTHPFSAGSISLIWDHSTAVTSKTRGDGSGIRIAYDDFGDPVTIAHFDAQGQQSAPDATLMIDPAGRITGVRRAGVTWAMFGNLVTCADQVCENRIQLGELTLGTAPSTGPSVLVQRFFFHDLLGSVVASVSRNEADVVRTSYSPFGVDAKAPSSGSPYQGFARGWRFPMEGLQSIGGRLYDPELGIFLQADQSVIDPADPLSTNRFAYAGNSPLLYADADGMEKRSLLRVGLFFAMSSIATYSTAGEIAALVAATAGGAALSVAAIPVALAFAVAITSAQLSGLDLLTGGSFLSEETYGLLESLTTYSPTSAASLASAVTYAASSYLGSEAGKEASDWASLATEVVSHESLDKAHGYLGIADKLLSYAEKKDSPEHTREPRTEGRTIEHFIERAHSDTEVVKERTIEPVEHQEPAPHEEEPETNDSNTNTNDSNQGPKPQPDVPVRQP